ncbi:hypothetical protein D3C71_2017270 [compost metagenome]
MFSASYFTSLPSTLVHVATTSDCCAWWSVLRISTVPFMLSTLRPSSAWATFTGSVELAFFIAWLSMAMPVYDAIT